MRWSTPPSSPQTSWPADPAEWQVLGTPIHTSDRLSFCRPDEELLILGDAVHRRRRRVSLAVDGPEAIDAALRTVEGALSPLNPQAPR